VDPPIDPRQIAESAASRAGVVTRSITDNDELSQVDVLFEEVWAASGPQIAMPVNLLRALVMSGNYVAGAWQDRRLVGAAVGFIGEHDGVFELHSHVAGVSRGTQSAGVGYALKLHQRAWALQKSIAAVAWTFDPLVRRNAWFNLVKLGATAVTYLPDLYGVMVDELNGTDETDRCVIRWDLTGPWPPPAPVDDVHGAPVLLAAGPGDLPLVSGDLSAIGEARSLTCQIPDDVVAIRRRDPGLAREWRVALRHTLGLAMSKGYTATSISRHGRYRLEI
jgi:predicted GNAT superfamily acetyltransferase